MEGEQPKSEHEETFHVNTEVTFGLQSSMKSNLNKYHFAKPPDLSAAI